MGSIRRKARTKPLPDGARFVTIVVLCPLLAAVGCESRTPARQALERGNSYYEQEDFESAIVAYTEAIRLEPDYAYAYNSRGDVHADKGDFDKSHRRLHRGHTA